jgi:hypothetical protein
VDEADYQLGCEFGRHWAVRDTTPEQLLIVRELGDAKAWVTFQNDAALEITRIIDPTKSGFMGTGEHPSDSFVAGFIHGAQMIETSSKPNLTG